MRPRGDLGEAGARRAGEAARRPGLLEATLLLSPSTEELVMMSSPHYDHIIPDMPGDAGLEVYGAGDDPLAALSGSIPGVPGEDYPIYAEVPETAFSCEGQVDGGENGIH